MHTTISNRKFSNLIPARKFAQRPTPEPRGAVELQITAKKSLNYIVCVSNICSLRFSEWVELPIFPGWCVFAGTTKMRDLLGALKPHVFLLERLVFHFVQLDNALPVMLAGIIRRNFTPTSVIAGS